MKKAISVMLCLLLLVSVYPSAAMASENPRKANIWKGNTAQPQNTTTKNGKTYYEISSCSELAYIAQEGGEWLNRNYLLCNDLILNDVELDCDEEGYLKDDPGNLLSWTPIGDRSDAFTGTFEGGGHTISGLYLAGDSDRIGLFGSIDEDAGVSGIRVENAYICAAANSYTGGIAGGGNVSDCSFSGVIQTQTSGNYCYIGGIVGSGSASQCVNYGTILGRLVVGNTVYAANAAGGIVGMSTRPFDSYECINYGSITGNSNVGGIAGQAYWYSYQGGTKTIYDCANYGRISGNTHIGGIVGNGTYESNACFLLRCYSTGQVYGSSYVGAVSGLARTGQVSQCFYLKDENINTTLFGDGVGNEDNNGYTALSLDDLRDQRTYSTWSGFSRIWKLDENKNGGLPYPAWFEKKNIETENVKLSSLSLTPRTLPLAVGNETKLKLLPSPLMADLSRLQWTSSDPTVASVNENGLVHSNAPGEAVITAACDSFEATCHVSVAAREKDEYRIESITVSDGNGKEYKQMPSEKCMVTVNLRKLRADVDGTTVMLASYDSNGQWDGLFYFSIYGADVGQTLQFTIPLDNTKGNISSLKVFPVSSMYEMLPLGAAASFPAQ